MSNRHDEFFCIACQLDVNDTVASPVPLAALIAPECQGKDISDDRHVWVSIRGTRFQCRCGMKKFDAKLRDARRRQDEREYD